MRQQRFADGEPVVGLGDAEIIEARLLSTESAALRQKVGWYF